MGDSLSEEKVRSYLKDHPELLEGHVMENVDAETLERWLIRRSQRDKRQSLKDNHETGRRFSLSRWKFCVHADKRKMLQTLMSSLASQPQGQILWELTCCVASAVGADGFVLHVFRPNSNRCTVFKRYHVTSSSKDEQNPSRPIIWMQMISDVSVFRFSGGGKCWLPRFRFKARLSFNSLTAPGWLKAKKKIIKCVKLQDKNKFRSKSRQYHVDLCGLIIHLMST